MPDLSTASSLTGLERARLFLPGGMTISLAETMGFQLTEADEGHAVIEMPIAPKLLNSMGMLHGGAISAVCDAAAGMAALTTLGSQELCVSVDLTVHFLRAIREGHLRAVGKVIKKGRSLILADVQVFDEQERLTAKSTCQLMTISS